MPTIDTSAARLAELFEQSRALRDQSRQQREIARQRLKRLKDEYLRFGKFAVKAIDRSNRLLHASRGALSDAA